MIIKKEEFIAEIGERIAEVGIKKFGSQISFAKAIGVNHNVFSKWKNGENAPDSYTLYKICESTGASAEWLFFGDDADLREIDREDFNAVFDAMIEFAKLEKIPARGDFYLAMYQRVKDLQKENKLSLEQAIMFAKAEFVEQRNKVKKEKENG